MKLKTYILSVTLASTAVGLTTSCDDILDKGNENVIYADDHYLTNPADTVTSVLGILNRLQGIAVRTNLLGEVRADLVVVNDNANTDLKEMAELNLSDDNQYNTPRDYFAVINNCNYYLANVDSLAGNANRNEKYFKNEIAQVHSIRAWAYLQLAMVYGRVPLVTEPVITKLQSEAQYPMVEMAELCDYFINDLAPYYGCEYPEYRNFGMSGLEPKSCFFPTQIVMGDLYLWWAVVTQDKEKAKQAAKKYYDYIMWDMNGKKPLTTNSGRSFWSAEALYNGNYEKGPTTVRIYGGWGNSSENQITQIAMDSASAEGYYNELRNLYNTTLNTDMKEASISPSDMLKQLSRGQTYVDYDTNKRIVKVTAEKLTDEQINKGYLGDLRYQHDYYETDMKYNSKEYEVQSISKHSSQHVSIYTADILYLRLAEALNYAGYPRFAKQILTVGLSNDVIRFEVSPYYTTSSDSAFISYFDFNNNTFIPAKTAGIVGLVERSNTDDVNMIGIHSRGSGLAYLNEEYAPALAVDSTSYPFDLEAAVPELPVEPDFVAKPSDRMLTFEEWVVQGTGSKTEERYKKYQENYEDSVTKYNAYVEAMEVYETSMAAYEEALNAFETAYQEWYASSYSDPAFVEREQRQVDQLILDEQALDLSYEGNRYYDLMRRAYWWNDNSKMVEPISKRTSAASLLNTRTSWFLNWKGKIGY